MNKISMVLIGDVKFDGRVKKEIRSLAKNGFEVQLIMFGNYIEDDLNEVCEIIVINRKKRNNAIINMLQMLMFNIKAYGLVKKSAPSFVHCHDLNTLFTGFLSRKIANIIYDSHELFPEVQIGLKKKIWTFIEKKLIKYADTIIVPEKNRAGIMREVYKPKAKFSIIENWPTAFEIKALANKNYFREKYNLHNNEDIILYTGILMPDRGIDLVIKAISRLKNCSFIVVGNGKKDYVDSLIDLVNSLGLKRRVFIHPAVPNSQIIELTHASDLGVAFYKNENLNNYYCASNKIFELIECGKYVITNNYPGLIELSENGVPMKCLNVVSIETITEAISEYQIQRPINNYLSKYIWENQEEIFVEIYSGEY